MAITIDFETRSRCDLKTAGAVKYSEDPSTEIQCLCLADDAGVAHTIYRRDIGMWGDIEKVIRASNIVAHNAEFELAIWNNVGVKRLGWPELPLHKLDCTAARAAMCSLPRNLEGACDSLGLPVSKDKIGYSLMLKMCKPMANGGYRDNPGDLDALVSYCLQDCLAEAALNQVLPELPALERAVWQYNVQVNMRGARIDRAGIEAVIKVLEEDGKLKLSEFQRLTKGHVMSPRQVAKLLAYLEEYGVTLPDLSKQSVAKAIGAEENSDIKSILEIRRSLGKASVSKYVAAIKAASDDDRMRGLFMYHGAGTGRWTASRFQPHNMIRDVLPDAGKFFETCKHGLEAVKNAYPDDDTVSLASRAGRAMVVPTEGKSFFVGDFAAIEGRGLAWLAGEKWVLDAYVAGKDMYRINAATIYHIPADSIPKDSPKRQVGKVIELACGYQGWVNAFHAMAKGYGVHIPDDEAAKAISAWRKSRPMTVAYWKRIGDAALEVAASDSPTCRPVGYVTINLEFVNDIRFMTIRLPSGRKLWYCNPSVVTRTVIHDDGREQVRDEIHFWGVDSKTRRWGEQRTYSGCLVENITQAVCRDILAASMFRAEMYGFQTVLHVHDEIVAEAPKAADVKLFEHAMSKIPGWAAGLPMKVEARQMERYGK